MNTLRFGRTDKDFMPFLLPSIAYLKISQVNLAGFLLKIRRRKEETPTIQKPCK